jgi:copper(I)-binding protein
MRHPCAPAILESRTMNIFMMNLRRRTATAAGALVLAGTLGVTACTAPAEPVPDSTQETMNNESGVMLDRAWAKSATEGMTSAFGTLKNTGTETITLVRAESTAAQSVELHEMAMVDGAMVMQELDGGLQIPAGSSRELAPGGEHLMLMGLTGPLLPGDEFSVTLYFSDDSSIDVVIPVRNTAGAEEEYVPNDSEMDGDMEQHTSSSEGTDPGGMDHTSDATKQ